MLATVDSRCQVSNKVTLFRRDSYLDPRRYSNSRQLMQGFSSTIQRRTDRDRATSSDIRNIRERPLVRNWTPTANFGDPSALWASRRFERQQSPRLMRSSSAPPSGMRKPKPPLARITGYGKGPAHIRMESSETGIDNLRAAGGQPWNAAVSSKFKARMRVNTPPTVLPQGHAKATLTAEGHRAARVTMQTFAGGTEPFNTMASATTQGRGDDRDAMLNRSIDSEGQMITGVLTGGGRIQADARRLPAGLARHHSI